MRNIRWFLVLVALVGCSASPPAPVDTCQPLASVTVCAPEFGPADLELSVRVWGLVEDCSDPDAIPIVIANLQDYRVGEADLNIDEVRIDPSAWSQSAGAAPTVAHEIGHILGYDHDDTICALMGSGSPSAACGAVSIAGCEFAL